MNIKLIDMDNLKLNDDNPRKISKEDFSKLVDSVKKSKWMLDARPIIVDSDNVIIGGNMRYRACIEAGIKKIPVLMINDLTEDKRKEFIIKDNVSSGEWDFDMLLSSWDKDLLMDFGLDLPDFKIDDLINDDDDIDINDKIDDIKTEICIGDLIEIGNHRLVCGDSTQVEIIDKLLDGNKPYIMITDPPYGVNYDPDWRNSALRSNGKKIGGRSTGKVNNDHNADWSQAWSLSPSSVAYIYHAAKYSGIVEKSLIDCDFKIRSQIIWAKNNFAIGRGDYHWMHEPVWYAVKKGCKSNWIGDRKQTTVWEISKNRINASGHSTQKPIECMLKPMRNHEGDIYDPFLGSGTTMIAANKIGRKCYGVEINPKYCQIIIDRFKEIDKLIKIRINGKYVNE